MVLRDGDELALAQAGRVLDDLLRAASGAVCEEGTEGRTSGDHQVRAADELRHDGRRGGEEGEQVGLLPQGIYYNKNLDQSRNAAFDTRITHLSVSKPRPSPCLA